MGSLPLRDNPPKADLLSAIYRPLPSVPGALTINNAEAVAVTSSLLGDLSSYLDHGNVTQLRSLFFDEQAYFRDTLAFTYHVRTFKDKESIVLALLKLNKARTASRFEPVPNSSQYVSATETLGWLELFFTFKTFSPRATCGGRITLLPQAGVDDHPTWKIWTLSTWLTGLENYPEDDALLRIPSERIAEDQHQLRTDVTIVGGGNSGLVLAARLKALGVKFIVIDQNNSIGDNWAKRYDLLRFHVPKSFCRTPYLPYREDASDPLTRDDLADQMRRFAAAFGLHVLHRTTVKATKFNADSKFWSLQVLSPSGKKTVISKNLVITTGCGSWAPRVPEIGGSGFFRGVNIHSAGGYKSAKLLAEDGAKSVLVIGSANTGFDIIEDCHNAGLKTVMIQRSPTYLIPIEYLYAPMGLGIYDHVPVDVADAIVLGGPIAVGGPLLGLTHAGLAAAEPDRYAKLKEAGFKVRDSREADLMSHLFERGGCHFVDMGHGVELISTRKVGVKSGVYPTSYTATGLRFSDGSSLDADAIVWCTGFRDIDVRDVITDVLGEGAEDIRDRMDAIWSLDAEGELRGMFKRHRCVENFWVLGHGAAHQRWYSKMVALQIKAELEGILPDAYRETPGNSGSC